MGRKGGRGTPRGGQPLTNIGTSIPPRVPLTGPLPPRVIPGPGALPLGIPVAQFADETPGPKVVAPTPDWESRWQPSKTPPNRPRPWVTGYRFWHADVAYAGVGVLGHWRVDMIFQGGHRHWYILPPELWWSARRLTKSVGEWLHNNVLRAAVEYPNGAL